MLKFEIKKLVRIRFLWFMLLLLSLIDVYKIYLMKSATSSDIDGHETIYNEIKGEVTGQKIDFVVSNYKKNLEKVNSGNYSTEEKEDGTFTGHVFGDKGEFEYFYNELKYVYDYPSMMKVLLKGADENIQFYQKIHNTYEVRKNQKIKDIYGQRKLTNYYEMKNLKTYLDYDFSSILVIVMILIGVPELMLQEKQRNMEGILCISKVGMTKVVGAKICGIASFVFAITIYFTFLDFISFMGIYGLDGLTQPLYGMSEYKFCSVNLLVYQFVILNCLIKIVAYLFLAYCMCCITVMLRRAIPVAVAGIISVGIFIWIAVYTTWNVNPVLLLKLNTMIEKYQSVSVFHYPVQKYVVVAGILMIGNMVLIIISLLWTKFFVEGRRSNC